MRRIAAVVLLVSLPLLLGCFPGTYPNHSAIVLLAPEPQTQLDGCVLTGEVRDEKGAPIAGAVLMVTGKSLGGFLGAATDLSGRFSLNLPGSGGPYDLRIEAENHYKAILSGFSCPDQGRLPVVVTLSPCEVGCTDVRMIDPAPMIDYRSTSD